MISLRFMKNVFNLFGSHWAFYKSNNVFHSFCELSGDLRNFMDSLSFSYAFFLALQTFKAASYSFQSFSRSSISGPILRLPSGFWATVICLADPASELFLEAFCCLFLAMLLLEVVSKSRFLRFIGCGDAWWISSGCFVNWKEVSNFLASAAAAFCFSIKASSLVLSISFLRLCNLFRMLS